MTTGFTCVKASVARKIDWKWIGASGYAYLMEFKFHVIHDLGASFFEHPIIFRVRRGGESKMSHHIIMEGVKTPLKLFLRRLERLPLVGTLISHSTDGFSDFAMPWRYLVSGISAAVANFATLYALTDVFGLWYVFSAIVSFLVSVLVSFIMQKFWTFKDKSIQKIKKQFIYYMIVILLSMSVFTGVICYLVLGSNGIGALIVSQFAGLLVLNTANRHFGGVSGDIVGASNEIGRLTALMFVGGFAWMQL